MNEATRRMALYRAYRITRYHVSGESPPFELEIDRVSQELTRIYAKYRVTTAAYLTAWNPKSQLTQAANNRAAQHRLIERIRILGLPTIGGEGRDPSRQWDAEESVLVPGMTYNGACAIARDFGQEALVFAGADAIPRLVVLAF